LPVADMTSNRPYLVRALYEWILDNRMTPYLLVDAAHPGSMVPDQFVQDGKIVLNISATAVRTLELGNERIAFDARFGGVAMDIEVPIGAVLGIYARENGRGMLFPDEGSAMADAKEPEETSGAPKPTRERPTLKVVK
jgi:stringent starvation protein B